MKERLRIGRKPVRAVVVTLAVVTLLVALLLGQLSSNRTSAYSQDGFYQHRKLILVGGIGSSDPKGEVFVEIVKWLERDLGYRDEDIIPFSYASGWDGFNATYSNNDTAKHVYDSASLMKNIYNQFPNEHFDIVGFSLGGVVALYAMAVETDAAGENLRNRTHTVLTLDSPVAGVQEELKEFISQYIYTFYEGISPAIHDLDANPPTNVVSTIGSINWSAEEINVVTLANTGDALLSPVMGFDLSLQVFPPFWEYPSGEYGKIDNVDRIVLEALTGDVDYRNITQALPPFLDREAIRYYHHAPKMVESDPAGERTKQVFMEEVILRDLNRVFVGTNNGAVAPALQRPAITTSSELTRIFIGNEDTRIGRPLTKPILPVPVPLTHAFIGSANVKRQLGMTAPTLPAPKPLTHVFVGNADASLNLPLKPPAVPLPGDANSDDIINALDITRVERIIAGLDATTPGADANQDGAVNAKDITKAERLIVGLD